MRILIVDDHEVVRTGVASLLGSEPGFTRCSDAFDSLDPIKAKQVRIEQAANGVGVEIEDQGKGIPAEKLDGGNNIRSGAGIACLQGRVRHFRGNVPIESSA